MAHDLGNPPLVIRVPAQVTVPGGTIPAAEWTEYKGRVIAQENKALGDLTDVDTSGAEDGHALVYEAGEWTPGVTTGRIQWVRDAVDYSENDVNTITLAQGLSLWQGNTVEGRAVIVPTWGTTANTIAQGNHAHQIRPGVPFPFPATGSLSSGTRTMVSGTVTGLDPARTYVIWGTLKVQLRGEGSGAGYSTPRITINGNAVNDVEPVRTVSGVPHTSFMEHEGVTVSGVSSVSVFASIAYQSGDPIHVGAGKLVIRVNSNR